MKIAFLGLGKMGTPMARHLLRAGNELTVWNRTPAGADSLVEEGATLAASPVEAVHKAEIVCTMLFDDEAVLDVMTKRGVLNALPPGSVHIVFSTISTALSEWLTNEHECRERAYVAAPVFGRPNVAEAGKLWIVVAGPHDAIFKAQPVFAAISRGHTLAGYEPRQAHAIKLGGNFLISAMIQAMSESFVFADAQGVPPEILLETVNSALFQSPFYAAYGKIMLVPPEVPGATIELGEKDLNLYRKAAGNRHLKLPMAEMLAEIFEEARRKGHSQEDWAAGMYQLAQQHKKH